MVNPKILKYISLFPIIKTLSYIFWGLIVSISGLIVTLYFTHYNYLKNDINSLTKRVELLEQKVDKTIDETHRNFFETNKNFCTVLYTFQKESK
ncbi:MAG: hypothetical protein TB2022_3290 [Candidatus Phytoplasma citri]|nr:MAG: hypothetical protein TB2022_3290 [Candidatus Phytoplasma aurantifolia]